jgi:hypothetical protein
MRLILGIAVLILSGCATPASRRAAYDNKLKTYVGQPIKNIIHANGVPTATANVPGGGQAHEYSKGRIVDSDSGTAVSVPLCTTTFFTDAQGIITNYRHEGPRCW